MLRFIGTGMVLATKMEQATKTGSRRGDLSDLGDLVVEQYIGGSTDTIRWDN